MRRTYHLLIATLIAAAPMPVAAQVSVDLNALNGLGGAPLPAPPPPGGSGAAHGYHHRLRHLARSQPSSQQPSPSAVASAAKPPAGPDTIEHPANLGPSFASLPALPAAAPPPAPKPTLPVATTRPPAPKPVETASVAAKQAPIAAPEPAAAPKSAAAAVPAPPPPPKTPTRLAEATPAPPAAQPSPPPPPPAPNSLPNGADRLTLPFFVQESDLPTAETAMLRDFAQRYGSAAHYIIRAFASPPAGDDDPSTPRRIALARAQAVAAALAQSGVQADRIRLLALGVAGGTPADRVEVIAMPRSSGHTAADSSP